MADIFIVFARKKTDDVVRKFMIITEAVLSVFKFHEMLCLLDIKRFFFYLTTV